ALPRRTTLRTSDPPPSARFRHCREALISWVVRRPARTTGHRPAAPAGPVWPARAVASRPVAGHRRPAVRGQARAAAPAPAGRVGGECWGAAAWGRRAGGPAPRWAVWSRRRAA